MGEKMKKCDFIQKSACILLNHAIEYHLCLRQHKSTEQNKLCTASSVGRAPDS